MSSNTSTIPGNIRTVYSYIMFRLKQIVQQFMYKTLLLGSANALSLLKVLTALQLGLQMVAS